MSKVAAYTANQFDDVVSRHTGLVKRIAQHLKARLPAAVQMDDLLQSGMIGLIEAAKHYDGSKGASFETYAGIRIRGAMIDEIRRGDWVPRSVHRNGRRISDAISELEAELGRDVKDTEVAEKLDISLDEYHHILNDVSCGKLIGIEDLGVTEDVLDGSVNHDHQDALTDGVVHEQFQGAMVAAMRTLPEREALVLSLYYNDELNLKEIGAVMDVSESRVSQIHSQAVLRLKSRLKAWL